MAIAIGGFMATGKTTIGRELANHFGWPFHDLDDVVNVHCLKQFESSISDLIVNGRESVFREVEQHCVMNWMSTLSDSTIVALGGGTLHNTTLGSYIEERHRLIVLKAEWNSIKQRIEDSQRPLRQQAEQLFFERRQGYQCGTPFYTDNKDISVCIQELAGIILGDLNVN